MDRIEPQNQRSRRTRAAILDATWDLLEELGAAQTSMAAVAARAGVTRRALYLHFASRAELLLALHAHVDERLDLAESVRPIYEAPDSVAALEAFAAHIAGYHLKVQRLDLAVARASDEDPDLAPLVEQATQMWHDGCLEVTTRLAREGRLAEPWTPDTAADLLWSFMFPETLARLTTERAWSADRVRELLTVVLRRSLVADRP